MKRVLVFVVMTTLWLLQAQLALAALQPKVLLLSGLGEPDRDTAFEEWKSLLGNAAIVGRPNLNAASMSVWYTSVRAEIKKAYDQAGHKKIGVVAHSVAGTAVLHAILKDRAVRQEMIDRVVLISPIVSGVDATAHDISGVLTFTGMRKTLAPSLEKGSAYFDGVYKLIKNTSSRIDDNPNLLSNYPKTLIVTSKDDGFIPVSSSNPTLLQFVSGIKVRWGLRHGRFVSGKRPILDIVGGDDPVYKLARFFLESNDAWEKIPREVTAGDRGEIVTKVTGQSVYLKQDGTDREIELRQNETTERYYLEGLLAARYHVFVNGDDGGEIVIGPAQSINTPSPLPGFKAPVASFSAGPTSGPVPLSVNFNATSSTDQDGEITSYHWFFGDQSTSSIAVVAHTYQREGSFTVILTVTDDDGLTDTATRLITVTGPNTPPIASFSVSPSQGDTNTTFVFNGTASSDPDGQIVSHSWNFGDNSSGTGATVNHKFSTNGTYSVVLTVTDNKGAADTETALVKVSAPNQPPTAILSFVSGSENPLTIAVRLTATDPDGVVSSATLDFGDGASGTITPGQSYAHTYSTAGSFTIFGTATDNSGATTTSNSLRVYDVDGDKYASKSAGEIRGTDCNDNDATVHPGATDPPFDNKDQDCDGNNDG